MRYLFESNSFGFDIRYFVILFTFMVAKSQDREDSKQHREVYQFRITFDQGVRFHSFSTSYMSAAIDVPEGCKCDDLAKCG